MKQLPLTESGSHPARDMLRAPSLPARSAPAIHGRDRKHSRDRHGAKPSGPRATTCRSGVDLKPRLNGFSTNCQDRMASAKL